MASSLNGSVFTSTTLNSCPLPKRATISSAPCTTWLFVRITPAESIITPDPTAVGIAGNSAWPSGDSPGSWSGSRRRNRGSSSSRRRSLRSRAESGLDLVISVTTEGMAVSAALRNARDRPRALLMASDMSSCAATAVLANQGVQRAKKQKELKNQFRHNCGIERLPNQTPSTRTLASRKGAGPFRGLATTVVIIGNRRWRPTALPLD